MPPPQDHASGRTVPPILPGQGEMPMRPSSRRKKEGEGGTWAVAQSTLFVD